MPFGYLGAFGFNTGVYGGLRFGGTVLRAPDTAWACRQGTIEAHFDSGVGYSLPPIITDVINAVLSLFTHYRLDRVGSILKAPVSDLFSGTTQIPAGCATPKKAASDTKARIIVHYLTHAGACGPPWSPRLANGDVHMPVDRAKYRALGTRPLA